MSLKRVYRSTALAQIDRYIDQIDGGDPTFASDTTKALLLLLQHELVRRWPRGTTGLRWCDVLGAMTPIRKRWTTEEMSPHLRRLLLLHLEWFMGRLRELWREDDDDE